MLDADENDHVQAYELVLAHIESGILDRTLLVGEQLPTERDLASQLGVSRTAVREAMRVLQTQGIITSSTGPGRGTRIAPSQGDALGRIFRLHLALGSESATELTETRVALERASVSLAASHSCEQPLSGLHATLAEMAYAEDLDAYNLLDTDFHVGIARASQIDLIADLTVAIRQSAREPIRTASLSRPDWTEIRARLQEEHRQILAAITARSPKLAADLVESHIRSAYESLGISPTAQSPRG